MTPRQARNQRRAAERAARKAEQRRQAINTEPVATEAVTGQPAAPTPELRTCAEINRANSQFSTGPRSAAGKANSSRNSFKHGLYSEQLVLPGEDPAELDALRADLRAEHQPANETEAILVNELAEQFWRLRRMRHLEARALSDTETMSLLALIQRTMASAERGFHKSLTSLRQLQNARGFVPLTSAELPRDEQNETAVPASEAPPPHRACEPETETAGFVSQRNHEANDSGFVSEDHEPSFEFLRPEQITPEHFNPLRREAA